MFLGEYALAAVVRMGRRSLVLCGAATVAISAVTSNLSMAQSPDGFTPSDEAPEDYPEGAGREETFYGCTACHGFKIVAQQGQSRRQWEDTLEFMTQKHNMPEITGDDRKLILDYLEASFPPKAPAARGWQNPFLKP